MHLLLVVFTLSSVIMAADREEAMNVVEMIRHWGYPVETHEVITRDGYVLAMYRISQGRHAPTATSCRRPPILLVHGLAADSAEFLMNPPESSPAMILADAGFDVFLLNHRGSTHSRKHLRLTPRDAEFWEFTMDEYANYDATAAVDKVLELNGAESLYWIGHSQGTIVGFMMLADNPEYNRKVKALFQLGPVGTVHYLRGIISSFPFKYETMKQMISYTGSFEIAPRSPRMLATIARVACIQLFPELCRDLLFIAGGPVSAHFNQTRIPVYINNYPCGTSLWNFVHFVQLHDRNRVDHFDSTPEQNMLKYGQMTAPTYDYSRITSDVFLFWSRNDWMTSPQELDHFLLREVKTVKGTFEIEEYNHFDYTTATNNAEKLFSTIIGLVRKYENC